jgi:hypothetical protein
MIPKDGSYAKESGEEVWDDVEGIIEIDSEVIFMIATTQISPNGLKVIVVCS